MDKELNKKQLEKASSMLKAMAHPMRLAIINKLDQGKQLTVTQIHLLLNIEQSTASHHLGILKDRGILSYKREGKKSYYSLKYDKISSIVDCIKNCI